MENIKLKPCPFCKKDLVIGENCEVRPNQIWTGMRYQVNHYEFKHWCHDGGFPHITVFIKAKTQEEIFTIWNRS